VTALEIIARLPWRKARAKNRWGRPQVPHEYTVRSRPPGTEADYVALYALIESSDVFEVYNRRRAPYLFPGDGRKYWHMGPLYQSVVNNRMLIEDDLPRLRRERWLSGRRRRRRRVKVSAPKPMEAPMPNSLSNEFMATVYEAGAIIYRGQLDVPTETQTLIETAFEKYRAELEAAMTPTSRPTTRPTTGPTTRSTTRPTTTPTTTPLETITTSDVKRCLVDLVKSDPGITKSAIIAAAPMAPTRTGVLLSNLLRAGELHSPTKSGPYYPPSSTRPVSNNTGESMTRSMQAAPTGDEI
jgi:hypothetical protein